MADRVFRRGDLVEVKGAAEILATLDSGGMLEGLPFMPEMLRFCGRRFEVTARATKICDTMHFSGSLELPGTVLLEDLRCDGSGHDGCQAECRIFWKDAWLRRVSPGEIDQAPVSNDSKPAEAQLRRLAELNATLPSEPADGARQYRCQATEHYRASRPLRVWDPRVYIREYTSGNVSLRRFLSVVARAIVQQPLRRLGLKPRLPLQGARMQPLPVLNLQPGELVRVKSRREIASTLTPAGSHRGIEFDYENLPYCGGTYRLRQRVTHVIDEHTGRMLAQESDWVSLEGVVCSGDLSLGRWFCPRAFHAQWSQGWLRRATDGPDQPTET